MKWDPMDPASAQNVKRSFIIVEESAAKTNLVPHVALRCCELALVTISFGWTRRSLDGKSVASR